MSEVHNYMVQRPWFVVFSQLVGLLAADSRELVFIGITSMHKNRHRRDALRRTWAQHCFGNATLVRAYEFKFLLSTAFANETVEEELLHEAETHRDIMFIDSPDQDPPVGRDLMYLLVDQPSAIPARLLNGLELIISTFGDRLKFYVHLDDDSFLSIPRLDFHINQNAHAKLYMGHLLTPPLKHEDPHFAQVVARHVCNAQSRFHTKFDLQMCLRDFFIDASRFVHYFRNYHTPMWALGMGMVWGRTIVDFIVRNRHLLKKRAIPDVQFGFWIRAIEGVKYIQMAKKKDELFGKFHDYPRQNSMFANGCHDDSVLVHRTNATLLLTEFDPRTCVLNCPA